MLKVLNVTTVGGESGKSAVIVEPAALEGAKRYVQTKASAAQLTAVTYGTAVTASAWTELTVNGGEITPASGDTVTDVVPEGMWIELPYPGELFEAPDEDCEAMGWITTLDGGEQLFVYCENQFLVTGDAVLEVVWMSPDSDGTALAEAFESLEPGEEAVTITLSGDAALNGQLVVPEGVNLILDLNGHRLTWYPEELDSEELTGDAASLLVLGDLTLLDSVGGGFIGGNLPVCASGGSFTMESGILLGEVGVAGLDGGTVTLNGGTVTNAPGTVYMVSTSLTRPRSEAPAFGDRVAIGMTEGLERTLYNIVDFSRNAITVRTYDYGTGELFSSFALEKTEDYSPKTINLFRKIMGFLSAAIGTVYAWFNNFSVYTNLKEKGYDVDFMDAVNNNFLSEGEPVC